LASGFPSPLQALQELDTAAKEEIYEPTEADRVKFQRGMDADPFMQFRV